MPTAPPGAANCPLTDTKPLRTESRKGASE
jgi:hypothetical protein